MTDLKLACSCGALGGRLVGVSPHLGTHLVCYCADCQAYARHLGHNEILDAAGGTDLFQTTTDRVEVSEGLENLRCLRMTRRGPLRWFAGCCGSPLANSAPLAAIPFAGVLTAALSGEREALGPVIAQINTASKRHGAPGPRGDRGMMRVVSRFARLALAGRMSGAHLRSPFFDAVSGQPVAAPHVLTTEERRRARRP